ncbi:hypothetical protein MBLNU457_4429t1 [Dothideomycetes sp. NU457]
MAEPQPPTIREGASTPSIPAANNEDLKAAAAMDSLDTHGGVAGGEADPSSSSTTDAPSTSKKEIDQKALGDALKQLDINKGSSNNASSATTSEAKKRADAKRAEEERVAEERRKVKVDAGDVALLTEQLDVSKVRATDLLKANGGDAVKAMSAWVTSSA